MMMVVVVERRRRRMRRRGGACMQQDILIFQTQICCFHCSFSYSLLPHPVLSLLQQELISESRPCVYINDYTFSPLYPSFDIPSVPLIYIQFFDRWGGGACMYAHTSWYNKSNRTLKYDIEENDE